MDDARRRMRMLSQQQKAQMQATAQANWEYWHAEKGARGFADLSASEVASLTERIREYQRTGAGRPHYHPYLADEGDA